jgi:arylsulfatase
MKYSTQKRFIEIHRARRVIALLFVALALLPITARGQEKKPNIVVIFGDDIGMWNVGA